MNKNSKIYIAGHNGMVGSAILRHLQKNNFLNIITKTKSELNLLDGESVKNFFEKEEPEYVFLAAAKVGGISANINQPADFIFENLSIQNNVIHQAHLSRVKKLLFIGCSCIYPKMSPQPIKEEYFLSGSFEPTSLSYSVARIAGITFCQALNRQYGDNFISIMPTNTFGPNDDFNLKNSHVMAALIRKFHEAKLTGNKSVECWGTGSPIRDFLYVDDLADACVFLMENYNNPEIINIGTEEQISIKELTDMVKKIVGYQGKINWDSSRPDGTPKKVSDISKLHNLGWKHKISLEKGIKITYKWYLKNKHDN
jgi:GDP-L-fucose synthase